MATLSLSERKNQLKDGLAGSTRKLTSSSSIKKNKPEQKIKNELLQWFWEHPDYFAWTNDSVGVYDRRGFYRKKTSKYWVAGVSDILAIHKSGHFVFVEVKSKVGRLSPAQAAFLMKMKEMGATAIVARSIDDLEKGLIGQT